MEQKQKTKVFIVDGAKEGKVRKAYIPCEWRLHEDIEHMGGSYND